MNTQVITTLKNRSLTSSAIRSVWLLLGIMGCGGADPAGIGVTNPAHAQEEFRPGEIVTNSIGMSLAHIPAGKFRMGSPFEVPHANDDEVLHEVSISTAFFMGSSEVTQGEYERVMGKNPSHFQKRVIRQTDSSQNPVESVYWHQATEFCRRLSSLPEEVAAARVYRLPTEAEWEYACRAGTDTAYSFGDNPDLLNEYAWCRDSFKKTSSQSEEELIAELKAIQERQKSLDDRIAALNVRIAPRVVRSRITNFDSYSQNLQRNALQGEEPLSPEQQQGIQDANAEREKLNDDMRKLFVAYGTDGRPYPSGRKKPNAWGLYDMHGNVREYCKDYYGAYSSTDEFDPQGPVNSDARVVRGGSYDSWRADCRAGSRHWTDKADRETGFRVVMVKADAKRLGAGKSNLREQSNSITESSRNGSPGFVIDNWASGLGCLSGVAVGPGGEFGTYPYVYEIPKKTVLRVVGQDSVEPFSIGFPPDRNGRIVFDAGLGSGSFDGDMFVSVPQLGGGEDLIYRVNPNGVASVFYTTTMKLTKGIAFGGSGNFGAHLYAINATTKSLLSIDPSGRIAKLGSGIKSHFVEDDLVITSDAAFGHHAFITDQHRGQLLRMPSAGGVTDFANIPHAMSIAQGEGVFGNFLYVGTALGHVYRVTPTGEATLFLKEFAVPPDADIRGIDVANDQMWLATDAGTLLRVIPAP